MTSAISPYLIAAIVVLLGIGYLGRFFYSNPKNYTLVGKSLLHFYVAATLCLLRWELLSILFRHTLLWYGLLALFGFNLVFMWIEHRWQWSGLERRNDWLHLCKRSRPKADPK